MPTSFTSYWGSQIHGIEIKWTHDPAAVTDVQSLAIEYTCNYYWRMPLWYDSAQADDAKIPKTLGSTDLEALAIDITGGANLTKQFTFAFFI